MPQADNCCAVAFVTPAFDSAGGCEGDAPFRIVDDARLNFDGTRETEMLDLRPPEAPAFDSAGGCEGDAPFRIVDDARLNFDGTRETEMLDLRPPEAPRTGTVTNPEPSPDVRVALGPMAEAGSDGAARALRIMRAAVNEGLAALLEDAANSEDTMPLVLIGELAQGGRQLLERLGGRHAPSNRRSRHGVFGATAPSGYGMSAALNHETTGALAIQEMMGLATKFVAHQSLPGLVQAASAAKEGGLDDLAAELESRARSALQVADDPRQVADKITRVAAQVEEASGLGPVAEYAAMSSGGLSFDEQEYDAECDYGDSGGYSTPAVYVGNVGS